MGNCPILMAYYGKMMQRRSESVCLKPFVGLEGKGVRPMGEAGNGFACHLRKGALDFGGGEAKWVMLGSYSGLT